MNFEFGRYILLLYICFLILNFRFIMVRTNGGDYVISENELRLLLELSFDEGVKFSDRY